MQYRTTTRAVGAVTPDPVYKLRLRICYENDLICLEWHQRAEACGDVPVRRPLRYKLWEKKVEGCHGEKVLPWKK